MTGPENYSTAEQILAEYEVIIDQGGDPGDMLQLAQVRALLASTAAFAMAQPVAGMPDEQGLDQSDFDDWYAAVNGLPPETRRGEELAALRGFVRQVSTIAKHGDLSAEARRELTEALAELPESEVSRG